FSARWRKALICYMLFRMYTWIRALIWHSYFHDSLWLSLSALAFPLLQWRATGHQAGTELAPIPSFTGTTWASFNEVCSRRDGEYDEENRDQWLWADRSAGIA